MRFPWIFIPQGFGNAKATVAAITGLVAKENVVGTFGILYGLEEVAEDGAGVLGQYCHRIIPQLQHMHT